jgi:competence protein ComEC
VLHKEIPFLRIGLPLCFGIITGLYIHSGIYFYAILISSGIFLFLVSLFFNRQLTNYIYGLAISLAFYSSGFTLFKIEKNKLSVLKPEETVFVSVLLDYPQEKENSSMLTIKLNKKISDDGISMVNGSLVLYHKKDSIIKSLLPGDILIVRCTPLEIVNKGNPYEFDYRFYMENKGIRYYAFTKSSDLLSHRIPEHRKLIYKALLIRERIIKMYEERGIKGDRLALVAAITLGQKNLLDPEQKQSFIKAGVMHIMAVSGLHAVILSLFIFNLLIFLKRRFNVLRIVITILILWAFAFVTGLTPSVLRATLMFSFLQAGNLMKRRVNGINSVLASAFVLILIRPSVIFDAGFLLSYAAVIYIIGFYQDLYLKIKFKKWLPDKIWQSIVVTLIAQAGTLPLTIMLFNRFPVYFILTNIIIVPLSSIMIIIGCLVPLTFPILSVSGFLASLLNWLTGIVELLTDKVSSLPNSSIENIGMTSFECILLTITMSLFIFFLLKKQSISIKYPVIALILFIGTGTLKEVMNRKANELIVYDTPGNSTIGIKTGRTLNLFTNNPLYPPEVARHCATLGLKLKIRRQSRIYNLLKVGNHSILICDSLKRDWLKDLPSGIIILTGNRPFIEKGIKAPLAPGVIIITSDAASGFHLPYLLNKSDNISFWSVRKAGAYRLRL